MNRLQVVVIVNALIWAVVIYSVNSILEGTPYATPALVVLGGGAAATIILLGSVLRRKEWTW